MEKEEKGDSVSFDTLFARNLPHILEKIFSSLDYKSFKTSMQVNKTWWRLLSTTTYKKIWEEILNEKRGNEEKLLWASMHGDINEVMKLINDGNLEVDCEPLVGHNTPLIEATRKSHKGVVKLLIDAGANVNKYPYPLLVATQSTHHPDIVHELLDAGAEVNMVDNSGRGALWRALRQGSLGVTKILIDHGAEPDKVDCCGQTTLCVAAQYGYTRFVKFLVEQGADPNVGGDLDGQTPLHFAADRNDQAMIKSLLERGADPNRKNTWKFTPLSLAARRGHKNAVKQLLLGGADPERADDAGLTPLKHAKQHGHNDVVQVLLDAGAIVADGPVPKENKCVLS